MTRERKLRSVSSSNPGPNRSVVDYETDELLQMALMATENCSTELASMLAEIEDGQPVQKVSVGR
jgi:hypothetical protein